MRTMIGAYKIGDGAAKKQLEEVELKWNRILEHNEKVLIVPFVFYPSKPNAVAYQ